MQCKRAQRREECGKHCFVVSDDDIMMMMKMMLIYTRKDTNNIIHQIKWLRGQKPRHQNETKRERVVKNQTTEQKKNHPFFCLSLWRAFVRLFSSVLSSLLSDRIRFRIGKIASLSTLINPSSSFLGARKSELRREKQTQRKSSSRTRRPEMFESVKEIVESYLLVLS